MLRLMDMRTAVVAAALAVALLSACGDGTGARVQGRASASPQQSSPEEGSLASRFQKVPEYPGEPWQKGGLRVPESELQLARGASHCGWEESAYIGGTALGTNGGEASRSVWSRDPLGVINRRTQAGFRAQASLPDDAVFTGYTQGPVELWTAPSDEGEYVYLVNSQDRTDVERWVAGGGGCA
jgi:hypothetical protein